jgi:hypothetical protein
MSVRPAYLTSPIKRHRSTKAEVERRRDALLRIVAAGRPMTVRQVFYQATVTDLVEKSEAGYGKVQNDLVLLRRDGALPYRLQRKGRTFRSIEDALRDTAALYRKNLWADADAFVEIWLEKDALSGVLFPITYDFDVPLMVARGYASLSFLHGAAEDISERDVPTYVYHLGDFDPSGVDAGRKIKETLRDLAPAAEIHFERLAVTPDQISEWRLPTRPTKATDSRARGFGEISVELDAVEPQALRDLVQAAIERHLPADQYAVLKEAEASERNLLRLFVDTLRGGAPA